MSTTKECRGCESLSDCFKNLSDEQLKEVQSHRVYIKYKKKEIVAKQGSFASYVIFIREGYLKLYIEGESDKEDLIINVFGPNQLIGLSSLFDNSTYQYSVSTLVPSELCLFEVKDIQKLISQNTEFGLSILRRSHRSTLHAYRQLYNLTHKQMHGRIASAFLYLSQQVFMSDSFEMILSRSELANFTAMSTMSAIRTINSLKEQGLIADEGGRISILNFDALEELARLG